MKINVIGLSFLIVLSSCSGYSFLSKTIKPKPVTFDYYSWECDTIDNSIVIVFGGNFKNDLLKIMKDDSLVFQKKIETRKTTGNATTITLSKPFNTIRLKINHRKSKFLITTKGNCYYYVTKKIGILRVKTSKQFKGPFL